MNVSHLALQDVDWMNAVAIPLVLSLTLGVALSIYTGLIAGRYVEFKGALRDALEIFMAVDQQLLKEPEKTLAKNNTLRLEARIGRVFFDQGQFHVHKAFSTLCRRIEAEHTKLSDALEQAGNDKAAKGEAFAEYTLQVEGLLRELKKLKINFVALALGHTLFRHLAISAYHYENLCEHIESGRPLAEIAERRNKQ